MKKRKNDDDLICEKCKTKVDELIRFGGFGGDEYKQELRWFCLDCFDKVCEKIWKIRIKINSDNFYVDSESKT